MEASPVLRGVTLRGCGGGIRNVCGLSEPWTRPRQGVQTGALPQPLIAYGKLRLKCLKRAFRIPSPLQILWS